MNQKRRPKWVIKLGTGILTNSKHKHDIPQLKSLVKQFALLEKKHEIDLIIVSSSAICAGMTVLGMNSRPTSLPEKQACAAIGQVKLMSLYEELFAQYGLHVAQVLLTHPDIDSRSRYQNAQNTIQRLLAHQIVPIINENDTVAVEEIKFGDNDRLSAHVAEMVNADQLVILTAANGLMTSLGKKGVLVNVVSKITPEIRALAKGTASQTSVGGMISKIDAAQFAVDNQIPVIIANGRQKNVLEQIALGKPVGTKFLTSQK